MKQMYLNRINSQERFENGPKTVRVKSRIGSRLVRKSLDSFLTRFCLISLFLILMGVGNVWGSDCNYISGQTSTINTYKSSNGLFGIGAKYKFYNDNSLGSLSASNNKHGVSAISCTVKLESVTAGKSAEVVVQYKVGSGSWTNIGSEVEIKNGNSKTFSVSNLTIAAGSAVSFRVHVSSDTEYGQNRSMSTSLSVRMAKSMSIDSTAEMSFGTVEYGKTGTAKTRTVTYSCLETGKTMSISCNNDNFTVSLNKENLDCSGSVTATVNFKPKGQGNKSGTVTIHSSNDTNDITFTVSGTGKRAPSSIAMNNGSVNVYIAGINTTTLDLSTLISSRTGNGAITYTIISATGKKATISTASINSTDKKTFTATECGTYTLKATQAQTDQYESSESATFTVTVNKLTPTIVFDNTDNPEVIYSRDEITTPAYRSYNGKEIDRNVVSYSSDNIAIYANGTTLTARDVAAAEGTSVPVTITASASADDYYNAPVNVTHNYAVCAYRSPIFYLDNNADNTTKTFEIGQKAIISYNENTDASLTVGTETEKSYISYVHDKEARTIIVTAVKGSMAGNGVQTITLNQPGNNRFFPRNKVYTFTVTKHQSTMTLTSANSMYVEDTITTPYTGLANTAEAVQFTCSPEGSMKMENGKLIALQAGTNTVTFSQRLAKRIRI